MKELRCNFDYATVLNAAGCRVQGPPYQSIHVFRIVDRVHVLKKKCNVIIFLKLEISYFVTHSPFSRTQRSSLKTMWKLKVIQTSLVRFLEFPTYISTVVFHSNEPSVLVFQGIMPQGRRKVPFSAKQKKLQLQNRRKRKAGALASGTFDARCCYSGICVVPF